MDAAALDGGNDVPARIVSDFFQCADGSMGLIHEYVERPWRGAGADENGFFASHQRLGKARCVAHHAIDDTVEEQFELSRNVTPKTGGTDDYRVGFHNDYTDRTDA